MALDHGVAAAGKEVEPTSDDELARGSERDPVHGAHGLPVADVASGDGVGSLPASSSPKPLELWQVAQCGL